jgi:hypothetical protein
MKKKKDEGDEEPGCRWASGPRRALQEREFECVLTKRAMQEKIGQILPRESSPVWHPVRLRELRAPAADSL